MWMPGPLEPQAGCIQLVVKGLSPASCCVRPLPCSALLDLSSMLEVTYEAGASKSLPSVTYKDLQNRKFGRSKHDNVTDSLT